MFMWSFGLVTFSVFLFKSDENRKIQIAIVTPHLALLFPQYGLDRILGEEKCLALLARAIDPSQPAMMTDVVKLLSAICIVGEDNMYVVLSFLFLNICLSD